MEAADIDAVNLKGKDTLRLNGQGATINGARAHRGLFVYSGTVTIENLTIEDTVAKGGDGSGSLGGGAGGGAGLGGGLFVFSGANAALSNVSFAGDIAEGGAGGGGAGGDGVGGGLDGGRGGGAEGFDGYPPKPGGAGGFGGGGGVAGEDPPIGGGQGGAGGFGGGGGAGGYLVSVYDGGPGHITSYHIFSPPGVGGFGGGNGGVGGGYKTSLGPGGGGGLGAGGDIFVQQGGSLTIVGGDLSNGTVTGGAGGYEAGNGKAFGAGLFLQGNQSVTFGAGARRGEITMIDGDIADQSGSGGKGANAGLGSVVIADGAVVLGGDNTYRGGTTIKGGALWLDNSEGAGTGAISFATADARLVLAHDIVDPANAIKGFTAGDSIDFRSVVFQSHDYVTFTGNGSETGGKVSVHNSDGAALASFNVVGAYRASQFVLDKDASGRLVVGYAAGPQQQTADNYDGDGVSELLPSDFASGPHVDWSTVGEKMASDDIATINSSNSWSFGGSDDFNGEGLSAIFSQNIKSRALDDWQLSNGHDAQHVIDATRPG